MDSNQIYEFLLVLKFWDEQSIFIDVLKALWSLVQAGSFKITWSIIDRLFEAHMAWSICAEYFPFLGVTFWFLYLDSSVFKLFNFRKLHSSLSSRLFLLMSAFQSPTKIKFLSIYELIFTSVVKSWILLLKRLKVPESFLVLSHASQTP